ncbi:site-specific tyrosine recombinase XerS (plasmid) [Alkalihalophilus pseudofirmus OF4]|uniref:Site-specific tyrosine recombinase XerS n=1 Tax=Alkalihalophilus pseudofirmus (strain ATCC BAA-2126 / JCM 17055 / OF4) TaxID=398511 RepID=D3G1X8_ALKPO|nr:MULTISPECIES: tyrosine recombinase XerS [Alkalihalophilus]ADC52354.1 site-specific tyrosine recombinase XerS [Alkalihalophilus pseudofirmus OF4]MED1602979.1 tyrosine recombinase XerS [Alkalihalophilus marmarensis]
MSSKQHEYYEKRLLDLMDKMPPYIIEYLDSRLDYRSSLTLFNYARDYQEFLKWLISEGISDANDIKEVSVDTLANLSLQEAQAFFKTMLRRKYLVSKKSEEYKQVQEKTVNRMKSALRSLFKYLTVEAEAENHEPYFHRNVMQKIPVHKVSESRSERAANMTEKIFIENADADFLHYVQKEYELTLTKGQMRYFKRDKERDFAILSLFLGSGIRLNELSNLKLGDVDFTQKVIRVIRKGNKKDSVTVIPEALDDLKTYLEIRNERYNADGDPHAYVFITKGKNGYSPLSNRAIQKIIAKYTESYDKRMSPHKLRHTYATNLAEQTGDIPLVMTQLGHSSPETSLLYINTSLAKAKKAAEEMGKRRKRD